MILQGAFSVWLGHRKGATKMKDFARFKPMQRHLFLYEKAVMFCKRRVESGEGADRYPSYSFKHCLKVRKLTLCDTILSYMYSTLNTFFHLSRFYTLVTLPSV